MKKVQDGQQKESVTTRDKAMKNKIILEIEQSVMRKVLTVVLIFIGLFLGINLRIYAQDKESQQNYQMGVPYSVSDIESVNLTNGNLMFNVGFGGVKGRGSAAVGFSLKYNSKLYESHTDTALDSSGNMTPQLFLRDSSEGGWMYDENYRIKVISRNDDLDQPIQAGGGCVQPNYDATYVWKLMMYFPDGSQHEFRPTGYGDGIGTYNGNGYFNVDPSGLKTDMSWVGLGGSSCPGGTSYSVNIVPSQTTNSKMVYYSTDGTYMRLEIPTGQSARNPNIWTVFMPDGSKVVNGIDTQNNPLPQKIYDKNGNFVQQGGVTLPDGTAAGGWVDEFGRYIARKTNVVPNEDRIYKLGFDGQLLTWKVRWKRITVLRQYTTSGINTGVGRGTTSNQVLQAFLDVVDEIELPSQLGGLKYKFTYNAHDGEVTYNPNTQNYSSGWGEITNVTLPSNAKTEYDYAPTLGSGTNTLLPLLGKIKEKRLIYDTVYDGITSPVTDKWLYSINSSSSTVTAPNGGVSQQFHYSTNTDNDLSGRVYKEIKSDGTISERIWQNNQVGGCSQYGCGSMRRLNTYVKTEFTTIPDASGNPSLTAIKDLEYDKNGNVTKVTEYDWVSYNTIQHNSLGIVTEIPSGAVAKRITENSFYNQTETAANTSANNSDSYWNTTAPNVRMAINSTTVKKVDGTHVSHSEFDYSDVDTTANLTEARTWDSYKNGTFKPDTAALTTTNSVSTKVLEYDSYGNPKLTTDSNGNQTQISYGSVNGYTGLYPTEVKSAFGTAIEQTVQSEYDFYTGLPTKVTALGNTVGENIVSETEYDAVGRTIKVKAAVGTPLEIWSTTEYNDLIRRVIVRSDIETKGDGKKIAVQHYDELGRVRLTRQIENVATQDPTNEDDGIKVQTRYQTGNPYSYQLSSNPYRAATSTAATNEQSMGWTRSKSVNTGKHSEVETFSGATLPYPFLNSDYNTNSTGIVTTDSDADRMLVTDQAGKQRISKSNALGQLTNVWEVKGSDADTEAITFGTLSLNGLKTSYQYDTLNNLTTVNQGVQTRTFSYSSLSRLLTTTNPEMGTTSTNGTIGYSYDANGNLTGKIDARSISTTYTYDALNRVLQRSYSNEPAGQTATRTVNYTYDGVANAKGKLTKVTTAGSGSTPFSVTDYQAFDKMGRVTQSQQSTDGTTYPAQTYTYNLSGALIQETYPSGRVVKNTLDNDGELAQIESAKTLTGSLKVYANSFTYTAAGAVSSLRLGNGRWESTQFNSRLQPTQIALGTSQQNALGTSANATNLLKLDYSYGTTANNGNVQSQMITVPTVGSNTGFTATQNYAYDSLNRIHDAAETVSSTQTWKQTFTYDRFGNRNFDQANTTANLVSFPKNCSSAMCAADKKIFDPAIDTSNNRLSTSDGYTFDASGNTTKNAQLRKFTYDGENKQTKVETVNSSGTVTGTLGEYWYDGDGKRVKKFSFENNQWITTIFVYDASGKMVAEYSTASATTPQVSYLTSDHLGSPRINTDENGKVTARHDYQPFGEEIATSQRIAGLGYNADDVRKKFTSYERDIEADLDFGQARYYSSKLGRFYSVDPENAGASTDNPQTWNAYVYVGNNPINIADPTGLSWYFNKNIGEGGTYKWYGDKDTVGKGYVSVVGNNGEAGSFSFESASGGYVTLDPYSNNYQTNIASKEDAIKLGNRLYDLTPDIRAFAAGFNKNYDTNMTLLTAMAAGDIVLIVAPVLATAATGAAVPISLGLTETAVAVPTGVAALEQLVNKAEFVEELTSKTQLFFRGNAQQIFDSIAQGATKIGPNAVRLSDGRVVSIYESTKAGPLKGPTIQVIDAGIKYVYRIKP